MSAEPIVWDFVRRLSVRVAIISEPNALISFNFWLLLPLGHMLKQLFSFSKFFFLFFLRIFFVFVNMRPCGSKNFKTLLLLQIVAKSFQTFPEFSSQWSSQNYIWDFWNFENWNFNEFYSFLLTWDPTCMGVNISKHYSYESQPKVWNLSWIFLPMVLTKLRLGFWNFEFLIFNDFFSKIWNLPWCVWRNQKPQLSGKWAIIEQNGIWDPWVVVQHIRGTFGLVAFKVILRPFGALAIFHNVGLLIRDRRKHFNIFWVAITATCKRWEIDMWLLIYLNRKPYMENPMTPSHLTLSDLERSKSRSLRFQALYLAKE